MAAALDIAVQPPSLPTERKIVTLRAPAIAISARLQRSRFPAYLRTHTLAGCAVVVGARLQHSSKVLMQG